MEPRQDISVWGFKSKHVVIKNEQRYALLGMLIGGVFVQYFGSDVRLIPGVIRPEYFEYV